MANLSEADEDELDRLDMAPGLTPHSRLACQAVVKGDVMVEIPSWNRNYVSEGGGIDEPGRRDSARPRSSRSPKEVVSPQTSLSCADADLEGRSHAEMVHW